MSLSFLSLSLSSLLLSSPVAIIFIVVIIIVVVVVIVLMLLLVENFRIVTTFKDGAYYCCCAYVLRISRYSGFLWVLPTNTGLILCGLKYTEKAELSKCFWYLKRKLGVTMHFSEIIKLQFRGKIPYIASHFGAF